MVATAVGRRRVRGQARVGGEAVRAHAIGAARRRRSDPAVGDDRDRADGRVAVRAASCAITTAGASPSRGAGRRHGGDGAGGSRPADEPRVRRRASCGWRSAACWCRSCRPSRGSRASTCCASTRRERLTEGKLSVVAVEPLDGSRAWMTRWRRSRPPTSIPTRRCRAIGDRFPAAPSGWASDGSRCRSPRRGNGARCRSASTGRGSSAAPTSCSVPDDAASGRVGATPPASGPGCWSWRAPTACRRTASSRPSLRPAALVMLTGHGARPDAAATLAYFREQDVTVKVISGDDPRTVGAIALELGLRRRGPSGRRARPPGR